MNINQTDLNELEFPELLAEIAPFAYSPKVAEKIENLLPIPVVEATISLKKTSEFLSSFESENAIPFNEYEDIESDLKLMVIENFRLENNAFIKIKGDAILNDNYEAAFALKHIAKDLKLAKNEGLNSPLANILHHSFQVAEKQLAEEDVIAIIKTLK